MPRSDAPYPPDSEHNDDENSPLDNFTTDVPVDAVDDAITESEQDAEEEIDQLDSDSDAPPEPQQQQSPQQRPQPEPQQQQLDAPAPKKPPPSRTGERRPGQTLLPTVRVENILQAEGLLGNLNLSKEGIFLLSVATEEFIRQFIKFGHERASHFTRSMVRYDDMAAVVRERYDFHFLRDTIPTPRPLASAFYERNRRERELLKDDPAMQFQGHGPQRPPSPDLPPVSVNGRHIVAIETPSGLDSASASRMKPMDCTRPPNKRPSNSKLSSSAVASGASSSSHAGKRPLNEPTETWEEWKERSRRLYGTGESSRPKISQPHSIMSNSTLPPHHPLLHASQKISDIPRYPTAPHWDTPETFAHQGGPRSSVPILNGHPVPSSPPRDKPPSWAGGLTGPGSAFLQGPGGPFPLPPPPPPPVPPGHHTSAVNPSSPPSIPQSGRTIYSSGHRNVENAD